MIRHLLLTLVLTGVAPGAFELRLPTDNQHLFTGELEKFYMYVDRTFEGQTSKPWQGGTFGFVRNVTRITEELVCCTKFHEGIDISPLKRDAAGNPLDLVWSISDGQVVHTSPLAGRSNYGKYVVVEHRWENSSVYSLYAHLAEVSCKPGDGVKAGSVLGRLGYTGVGLSRTRAHLHLEVALLMSRHYPDWHKSRIGSANHHGLFNGMNLMGFDAARLFIEHKANPQLRIGEFIASVPPYFKVTVPSKGVPDFVTRYPWICPNPGGEAVSWEISFSATGLPVAFAPSLRKVDAPLVTAVQPSAIPHRYLTRNLIIGQHNSATLTASGKNLVALLTDDFPLSQIPEQPAMSTGL